MFLVNSTLNLMYLLFIYRLASTPAMFNSTLTQDDASSCPVDGSIMITGTLCSLFYFPFLLEGNKQLCLICFLLHHNTSSDYWDKHLIIVWLCKISRTRYNADAVLEAHILKKWMSNNKFFQVYCFWDYELAAICTPILWSWLSFFFTSFHMCRVHWLVIFFFNNKNSKSSSIQPKWFQVLHKCWGPWETWHKGHFGSCCRYLQKKYYWRSNGIEKLCFRIR